MVAADAQRQIDAEVDAVGVAQLDLRVIAHRAEDAHVGDDSLAGADDRDQLLGGELALLVQVFELGELGAGAEEGFEVGLGHVHVTGRHVHDQRMRRPAGGEGHLRVTLPGGRRRARSAQSPHQRLADQMLDFRSFQP